MADNVLEQTIDKEIHISSNQIACTIIENLLPFSNYENFERFQNKFAANFRPICSDKFASHILQKLVAISFLRSVSKLQPTKNLDESNTTESGPIAKKRKIIIPDEKEYNLNTEFNEEHRKNCCDFVLKASKFLLNNLEDFVWDAYASHVIRTCFDCLSGTFQFKRNFITNSLNPQNERGGEEKADNLLVPDDWLEVLQEYGKRLELWPQFIEFPYDELSSGLLQSLFMALKNQDKNLLKHLGKRILNESFLPLYKENGTTNEDVKDEKVDIEQGNGDEEINEKKGEQTENDEQDKFRDLPQVFSNEASIRCLETLINVAGPKLFTQIYVKLFCNRLSKLSRMRSVNFSVQKLLSKVRSKEEFEPMFDELSTSFEDLLQLGHTGVVCSLAQSCLRLCVKQGPFMQQLQAVLDCAQPKERSDKFIILTLKLKPFKIAMEDTSNFIHIHGALILESMLQFNKPIKLVQCMLDMKNTELSEIFCSPKGSHVVDAFMQSKSIGEKSREKLIRQMNGCYLDMATSRHGSWAVEKFFTAAGDSQKAWIVKELAEKINQLNGSPSGRLLNHKLRVELYRISPDQWRAAFNKENKAEKLFKDII